MVASGISTKASNLSLLERANPRIVGVLFPTMSSKLSKVYNYSGVAVIVDTVSVVSSIRLILSNKFYKAENTVQSLINLSSRFTLSGSLGSFITISSYLAVT
jgi:hypothetical protein